MPLSTDVTLPRSAKPTFAPLCIVCGADSEDETVTLSQRTSSWIGLVTFFVGRKHTVRVPCCAGCERGFRSQHRRRAWSGLPAVVAAMIVLIPLTDGLPSTVRRVVVVGAAVLLLVPQILYEVFRPLPFDMTVGADSVDYEIR